MSNVENIRGHVEELRNQAVLSRKPQPFQPNPAEQRAAERLGKPPPAGAGGETGLSEELQQREEDYVARANARLANSSFTEEEKQGHKERLIDILDAQNAQVARLKDLSWVREDMQRAGFNDPVEWLISEGDVIPAPPAFGRFRRPLAWFRNERDQLYRDKVKEVVRYWREQGFL
jgi:G3E family GTPase